MHYKELKPESALDAHYDLLWQMNNNPDCGLRFNFQTVSAASEFMRMLQRKNRKRFNVGRNVTVVEVIFHTKPAKVKLL